MNGGKTIEMIEAEERKARVIELAHQIEGAMNEICRLAEKDRVVEDLICEKYPFKGSLDEVANEVNEWRFAMKEKV